MVKETLQSLWLLGWLLAACGWINALISLKTQQDAEDLREEAQQKAKETETAHQESQRECAALREKAVQWERIEERGRCVQAIYEQHHKNRPHCPVQVLQTIHCNRVAAWPVHLN